MSTSSNDLFSQIENNAIKEIRLHHDDEELIDDIRLLIDALEKNTSIECIHFQGEYLGCLRGDKRSELLEVIGDLPKLQELSMSHSLLMAKVLTTMLSKAKKLRVLRMEDIVFQGIDEDISSCEMALLQHPSLKEFDMIDCSAAAVHSVSIEKLEKAGKKLLSATASQGGYPGKILRIGATVA